MLHILTYARANMKYLYHCVYSSCKKLKPEEHAARLLPNNARGPWHVQPARAVHGFYVLAQSFGLCLTFVVRVFYYVVFTSTIASWCQELTMYYIMLFMCNMYNVHYSFITDGHWPYFKMKTRLILHSFDVFLLCYCQVGKSRIIYQKDIVFVQVKRSLVFVLLYYLSLK